MTQWKVCPSPRWGIKSEADAGRQAGSLGVSELPAEGDKAGFLRGRTSKHPQWGWGGPGHACLYPEAGASTLSPNTWAWAPCCSVCPAWVAQAGLGVGTTSLV